MPSLFPSGTLPVTQRRALLHGVQVGILLELQKYQVRRKFGLTNQDRSQTWLQVARTVPPPTWVMATWALWRERR